LDATADLHTTPLTPIHRNLNARMIPFAGWEMPLEYSGIADEHMAVRTRAGVFDVSHMGEIEIAGSEAVEAVQYVTSNDAGRLSVGEAQYSTLLTPEGTCVDDLLVYRMAPKHFMLVVNAANTAKDVAWIRDRAATRGEVAVVDSSSRHALLAVQGPLARDVLQPLTGVDLGGLKRQQFAHGEVASALATVSRTGYTGEDGYEVFLPPKAAPSVWRALFESGRSAGIVPCGLGARDTLRLEAGLRLCGQDMDETTTVLEAGLGWTVGWSKNQFVGRERLLEQKAGGVTRRLVGFELLDPGIARPGHSVMSEGVVVGKVTSGTRTPFLQKPIGLAYVPIERAAVSSEIEINIRGREVRARIVRLPFYARAN
jgi:aminomethyltransferase